MIIDERLTSYINSLSREEEALIEDIRKEAETDQVPIIRRETADWLRTMLLLVRPKKVLEIGAAVGYSAIFMSRYIPDDGHITTIENWEPRIRQAEINIERAGAADRITLIEGDAMDVLSGLVESFDMIFVDAAKGQYINYLPEIIRILNTGGIIISDNVLFDGEVMDSRFVVDRRDRTIHERMRQYLYEITHNECLATSVLPLGDGVSFSVKVK